MIQSMTGYGKAEINLEDKGFTIEVKSLNSKQIDASVRMPSVFRDKEIGLRKLLSEKLQRGKVDLFIWKKRSKLSSTHTINASVIKEYHNQILKLQEELNIKTFWGFNFFRSNQSEIIPTLLKMPRALIEGEEETIGKNEWNEIENAVNVAISNLQNFRLDEGKKLEEDIQLRINKLDKLLNQILPFAKDRITKVKKNLSDRIEEMNITNIDNNRFEQELIYYLEKQDITEEQVRLSSHLEYFLDTMKSEEPNGKKLGFISQEMGREINTIGSKSLDAAMQKIVVQMKDELEKIKEQLLNVL